MKKHPLLTKCLFAAFWSLLIVKNLFAQGHVKGDEKILFFPTAAHHEIEQGQWNVPIHGWIFEPEKSKVRRKAVEYAFSSKFGLKTTPESKQIFDYRVNLLLADNERGKKIRIRIAGGEYPLSASAKNGHFKSILQIPDSQVLAAAENGTLPYEAILRGGDNRKFTGTVLLVPPKGLSVISDIDDTIKVSDVLDRKKLMSHTFYEEFKAAEGMAEFYQRLASEQGAVFHFVSSSPWHLYEPLSAFVEQNKFPPAEFHLKDFRFKDKTLLNLFKDGTKTKPPLIKAILARYPKREFILIGDSGEQDPEVYAGVMREFPKQIIRCLIRNVTDTKAEDERFSTAFAEIPAEKWQLFSDASTLELIPTR